MIPVGPVGPSLESEVLADLLDGSDNDHRLPGAMRWSPVWMQP